MAKTATAPAPAPVKTEITKEVNKPAKKDSKHISGPVGVWKSMKEGGGSKPIYFTIVTITFADLIDNFYVSAFTEQNISGFQRPEIPRHVQYMGGVMREDEYTPAPLVAGLSQFANENKKHPQITIPINGKNVIQDWVTIPVSGNKDEKLPLLDGNHRRNALMKELEVARKAENKELEALILSQALPLLIILDHEHLRRNFQRLQLGRAVNSNVVFFQKAMDQQIDNANVNTAIEVANMLDDNNSGSHLTQQVSRTGQDTNALGIKQLATDSASLCGLNLYGGACIMSYFKKDVNWLKSKYVDVWKGLNQHAPDLLKSGKMLTPHFRNEGSKGGSFFLIGLGNMLAFRSAFLGRDSKEDVSLLIDICKELHDRSCSWSASDKREELHRFAEKYFEDLAYRGDETVGEDPHKCVMVDGVPKVLALTILKPSTFALNQKDVSVARGTTGQRGRPKGSKNKTKA